MLSRKALVSLNSGTLAILLGMLNPVAVKLILIVGGICTGAISVGVLSADLLRRLK